MADKRKDNHRPFDLEMESKLLKYFQGLRDKHLSVSGLMLKAKCIELCSNPNMKASNGWQK